MAPLVNDLVISGLVQQAGAISGAGSGVAYLDDSAVTGGNGGALVLITHGHSAQSVQSHAAGFLTGQLVGQSVVNAVVQLQLHNLGGHIDLPAGAHIALDGGVIAQGSQQHLGKSIAGQLAGGAEGAVAVAGDDAQRSAVADVAGAPAGGGHIGEGGHAAQLVSGGGPKQDVSDDLGSLLAGQGAVRIEGTIFVALDDPQGGHDGDRLLIADRTGVSEISVCDGDKAHSHNQSQHQRENLFQVSHGGFFLLLNFSIKFDFLPILANFSKKYMPKSSPKEAYYRPLAFSKQIAQSIALQGKIETKNHAG